ncbi:MAG: hypothetical protein PX481_09500 [Microcystis sp. M53603_WE2]|uniref:hypothetical protein n=1 Tax=unclassified Microcystis TaxID=2643300 RepID=UPI0018AD1F80|nr:MULTISPECIES: hypothetical protein [unclassified Microcystis]MCZ8362569.1 hypothetical protein [Microcystis sp. LE19-251.1A]MDJ0538917.1 hypothetical protein [Microcystis sp. M53603_WE2]MDJ0566276.1 hypothetical protein [Microcystis sp. M49629_WE12]MDJ0606162.1 hypothetical protein [Microcystis sp. M53602_WE12]
MAFIYSPPATRTKWSPHLPTSPHPTPHTPHPASMYSKIQSCGRVSGTNHRDTKIDHYYIS